MKRLIFTLAASIPLTALATPYYTNASGYSSSTGPSTTTAYERVMPGHSKHSVVIERERHSRFYERQHHKPVKIQWRMGGNFLPQDAVVGGGEYNRTLYICRAKYKGGIHPGKLIDNRCNISWKGKEISINRFEILESNIPLSWIPTSGGDFPVNAIQGGRDAFGTPLYICQTTYRGGMHPGKLVGQACQISWGGKTVANRYYQVLVS